MLPDNHVNMNRPHSGQWTQVSFQLLKCFPWTSYQTVVCPWVVFTLCFGCEMQQKTQMALNVPFEDFKVSLTSLHYNKVILLYIVKFSLVGEHRFYVPFFFPDSDRFVPHLVFHLSPMISLLHQHVSFKESTNVGCVLGHEPNYWTTVGIFLFRFSFPNLFLFLFFLTLCRAWCMHSVWGSSLQHIRWKDL